MDGKTDSKPRVHVDVAGRLHEALSKIPGVTGLEMVVNEPDCAVWGMTCEGVRSSITWSVTP